MFPRPPRATSRTATRNSHPISADCGDRVVLSFTGMVGTVEEELVEGMERGHEDDAHGHETDEHVWTSLRNAKSIVEALSAALCEASPERTEQFRSNTESYLRRLGELDGRLRAVSSGGSRNTVGFGDRFPFRYLADEYALDYCAASSGCSTDTEASAATIALLIEKVREEIIPVVFQVKFSNGKIANTICEDTGVKTLLLHSCHNVSKAEFDSGVGYLKLMEKNAEGLKEALS